MIVVGLMSGTSADAIDAAVVEFRRDGEALALRLLGYTECPYPPELQARLRALRPPAQGATQEVCELHALVGEAFAAAALATIAAAGLPAAAVDLVASHGQTVYHQVAPGRARSTLQLGAPAVIAERTGRTVAADFRPRDVAAGGQGAPLLPLLDALLCAHPARTRTLQNIGGIANVTWVPPTDDRRPTTDDRPMRYVRGSATSDATSAVTSTRSSLVMGRSSVVAFDTGPGNCLIDEVVWALSGGRRAFDEGGAWALAGAPDEALLAVWLAEPYFALPPPKSTGREHFSRAYAARLLEEARAQGLAEADIVATVTALTARSVALAYRRFLPAMPDEVLVSGGGAHNQALMRMLAAALPAAEVRPFDALGLPGDAKEAVGFALLGYYALHGWPGNLVRCTGAAHPAVLGSLTPGDNYRALLRRALAQDAGPPVRAALG
ncbi:MAG TPA: anhydro-N-acetylmuramic acid kinase [Roseiflexaceae bacterium]|nr:anhydro-N-acetylmuramic acid kinase [Roseiflexaceae bacterium]